MNKARRAMMCLLAMTAISLSAFYGARADVLPFPTWNVKISFSAGGGSGYMSPVTKTYKDNGRAQYYTLPSCKFTRTGYAFAGWRVQDFCSPDSGVYRAGYSYELCGGDLNLTATWKSNAKTHVLTLYRNNSSGDGASARRTVAEGSYYTLPTISSLGWTRSGYRFKGWATYRGATSADYGDGASVYVSSSLTSLYAVWEEDTHVMTLYRNNSSGDGAGARRKVPNGGYYTLPTISSLGWERSGYIFKGWATDRGATTATYGNGDQIYIGSGLASLYAVWANYWQGRYPAVAVSDPTADFTADDLKFVEVYGDQIVPIVLEANGGIGGPYLVRVRTYWDGDMDGYTLPECPFARSGYKFVGWDVYNGCCVADSHYYMRDGVYCGGGYAGTYQPGFFYYVCASTVLRAKWAVDTSAKTHVMTLYRNNSGGDGAGARRKVPNGGYYTLPTISSLGWTRSGYTFKGWATYRGGSVSYGDGGRIYVSSSLSSLYAVWQSNVSKHVMTLYRNNSSGDGAGARRTVTDNGYYTLPTISSLGWSRSGYTFKGWSTYRGATYETYGDGERIYVSSSLSSLYAVWEASAKYTVVLHRNNSYADGATARRTMLVDSWRNLPTIDSLGWSRSGYYFAGWAYYPEASY